MTRRDGFPQWVHLVERVCLLWQRGFSTDFSPDIERNRGGKEVAVVASIARDYYPLEFGSWRLSKSAVTVSLLVSALVGACMEFYTCESQRQGQ